MNFSWFAKTAITTAFLGHLGELNLAGGALEFTFASVTGFSVLNGLSSAMKPIRGQAHGANNVRLFPKTLLMTTLLFVGYLNPFPLKSLYLSPQCMTLPTMFSSAVALAFHIPFNILFSKAMGLRGVSLAVCALSGGVMRFYSCFLATWQTPSKQWGFWSLCSSFNFEYLLYSVTLSLATCVSTRVSNELGANQGGRAYKSARVSLAVGVITGCIGGSIMVAARGFSHDKGVIKGVKKTMQMMALVEVFNFTVIVCGRILQGTACPRLGMYAYLGGAALSLSVAFAFKLRLGLDGLLIGVVTCLILLLTFIVRINWVEEATKAQTLVCTPQPQVQEGPTNEVNELIKTHQNH
ncbi:hypothetical protein VNO78_24118 [Psophocarpus tetragonolobus]|uniref:Uncharacterized protein n=1 Tax=Psophocarpus tetragonolobus TaxID=3891 RepID=A0AAN9S4U2_PSOTE